MQSRCQPADTDRNRPSHPRKYCSPEPKRGFKPQSQKETQSWIVVQKRTSNPNLSTEPTGMSKRSPESKRGLEPLLLKETHAETAVKEIGIKWSFLTDVYHLCSGLQKAIPVGTEDIPCDLPELSAQA